jgi:capsule biosynthesis phosphatase
MIYCFDLDDTICYPNHTYADSINKYAKALPNIDLIKRIKFLHKSGHKIIVYSARRMLTHQGDLKKIYKDVGNLTEIWLKENHVPYDELIFGKPYADFYIDDKAVNVADFGDLN